MVQTLGTPAQAYAKYMVPAIYDSWTGPFVARAAPRPGERVLDVACGTGVVTRAVAPMVGSKGSVVGLDVSQPMLDVARSAPLPSGSGTVEWVQASATDMPLPDDDVDVVLCQQGLQFFPDRGAAAAEMHRVLRPGGRLALAVWRSLAHNHVPNVLNDAMVATLGVPAGAAPFAFDDVDGLRQLMSSAGFTDISIEQETRPAVFESLQTYIDVLVEAGAAVIPALGGMAPQERAAARLVLHDHVAGTLGDVDADGQFRFPLTTVVAVARRPDAGAGTKVLGGVARTTHRAGGRACRH